MESFFEKINKNKGQSTVEYILLIAMLSSMGYTFLNSASFKKYFGKNSSFITLLARSIEFSYHHAGPAAPGVVDSKAPNLHQSFYNAETNGSKFFFSPENPYGN